jgi:hypothetical protein
MMRGLLAAIGGLGLLVVGVVGGVGLLAAAMPQPEPLPTMSPIVPVAPGGAGAGSIEPAPEIDPDLELFEDIPGQRWGDVLLPDDVLVTNEQLAEYGRANEWRIGPDVDEFVAFNRLVIDCMADAGFWHDPRVFGGANGEPLPDGFALALGGDTGAGDAYRWEDAGCRGGATHKLGITS